MEETPDINLWPLHGVHTNMGVSTQHTHTEDPECGYRSLGGYPIL